MAPQKPAASARRAFGEGGRGFEHAGEPLGSNANPSLPEYQPITLAEWARNRREVVRVGQLDQFSGREPVDLRAWWHDAHGDLRPGRAGITLAIRHLPSLAAAFNEALNAASDLGLIAARIDESQKKGLAI
jgi:hypothetical protein